MQRNQAAQIVALISAVTMTACTTVQHETPVPALDSLQWWKGNLHTHSFWSDGDDYPEMVVDWYKAHGYHFIQLSDHNILAAGERWISVARRGGPEVFEKYVQRFGRDWVVERSDSAGLQVRLKTIDEYRPLFEESGRFLVLQGEEITDDFESKPIHVNATNAIELIPPQGGTSVRDMIQRNVDAVLEQRRRTGQPMFPHLNHPNFGWAVTVEDLIAVERERFFEVYNGHPAVRNNGDETHLSTERMWDIVLTERLRRGGAPIYGIAVDDAHNYHDLSSRHSNPGRGWVMVRAAELSAAALISAMEAGEFYASTGVELLNVRASSERIDLEVRSDTGITYTTHFLGTRRTAPEQVGIVLASVAGPTPAYEMHGDELYVRAKVVSSRLKANPYSEGEFEVAWSQPLVLSRPREGPGHLPGPHR